MEIPNSTLNSMDQKVGNSIEQGNAELYGEKPQKKSGSVGNGSVGISFEDTRALLQQLRRFQETIGGDWKSVLSQWQNLRDCWKDRQYDRFEPFFEQLCRTYDQCESQCEEYNHFLEERIRSSEDATTHYKGPATTATHYKDPVTRVLENPNIDEGLKEIVRTKVWTQEKLDDLRARREEQRAKGSK